MSYPFSRGESSRTQHFATSSPVGSDLSEIDLQADDTPTAPGVQSTYSTAPTTPYWNTAQYMANPIELTRRLAEEVDKIRRKQNREMRFMQNKLEIIQDNSALM